MAVLSNLKHEHFCNERMSGKSGAAAYRAAYGERTRGADQAASRLLKRDDIQARIKELQDEVAQRHEITVDSLIEKYTYVYEQAKDDPRGYAAAINAQNSIARITGNWKERVELSVEQLSDEELASALKDSGSIIDFDRVLRASRGKS